MMYTPKLKILFIGNSLTYVCDVPERVAARFREAGYDCETVMLAHPAWFLEKHVKQPDVRFNIRYGHYDYVVLQEHSHPFAEHDQYLNAVRTLDGWIRESGAKTVIYSTWTLQDEPEKQPEMNRIHEEAAQEVGAILAHAGEGWWEYQLADLSQSLYCGDREHATPRGAAYAAGVIYEAIQKDLDASMHIRPAAEADVPGIAAIYDAIHTQEEAGEVTIGWNRAIYPTEETARVSAAAGDLFVGERAGRIVAAGKINREQVQPTYSEADWAYAAGDGQVMVLHTLVIDPACARQGLAAQFVRFYENYARRNGCTVLRIDTNEINCRARAMYRKLGYREASILPCVFNGISGVNLVCLEKKLSEF